PRGFYEQPFGVRRFCSRDQPLLDSRAFDVDASLPRELMGRKALLEMIQRSRPRIGIGDGSGVALFGDVARLDGLERQRVGQTASQPRSDVGLSNLRPRARNR